MNLSELQSLSKMPPGSSRDDMIFSYSCDSIKDGKQIYFKGVYEPCNEKWGFLRFLERHLAKTKSDVYLSPELIKKHMIREGDILKVAVMKKEKFNYLQADKIILINDKPLKDFVRQPYYKDVTTIFPDERIKIDEGNPSKCCRLIDMISPIGYGQRGIISSLPKAGKTTVIENMSKSIAALNNTEVIILMIAERPEEYSYIKGKVPDALILCSSFDEGPQRHVNLTSLTIAYCLRKAEMGCNVILFIDSLTRYVRAANLMENGGKTLTGGLDAYSLLKIKGILGAARNMQDAGSLTIVATMLVGSVSKMDELIANESLSTSNWDLVLSEDLARKGYYPSIDIVQSSTRRYELMMDDNRAASIDAFRKIIMSFQKRDEMLSRALIYIQNSDSNEDIVSSLTGKK